MQRRRVKYVTPAQINTRKLSQQSQVGEPKAQHSSPDGINKDIDASDYVLVSAS
ncbi:unnamed protein product [Penicillium roqueforti FM164]|uniref:Uncharacterized protein n=1 Tax=Penicillium roqueforti (strain FM164) TaxID=1365484 RepID=W6QN04_PENRF|nr:unnamed protein product [Penicillium roqueforti FM164]